MRLTLAAMREMTVDELRTALDVHRERLNAVRAAISLHEAAIKELSAEMAHLTGGAWSRGTGAIADIESAIATKEQAEALAVEWDAACDPVWEVAPPECVRVRKVTSQMVYMFDKAGRGYRFHRKNGKSTNSYSTATIRVGETIAKHEQHRGGAA
jgi:hypothetical protein